MEPKNGMDYDMLVRQVDALLEGESDPIANAANFAAFVFYELPGLNWAGFYFAAPGGLVLGPFSGRPACTRLPEGRGVCGAAFTSGTSRIVDDVNAFADHIVCDSASQSELVVPLIVDGTAIGVFDIDAPTLARFNVEDRDGVERLVASFLARTPLGSLGRR